MYYFTLAVSYPVVRRRLCSLAGVHNAFHNYIYRLVTVACHRHAVHLMPDDMGLTWVESWGSDEMGRTQEKCAWTESRNSWPGVDRMYSPVYVSVTPGNGARACSCGV